MSWKQLEEAIKNRHNTNIVEWRAKHPKEPMTMFEQCACDLELQFRKVEVEFDAFKKQLQESSVSGLDIKNEIMTAKYHGNLDVLQRLVCKKWIPKDLLLGKEKKK